MLCFALLALTACSDNLFGSGGSSGSDCRSDIKCWRLKAENEFRSGKYADSYESYSKIVSIDSTASVGYFGMAKAGLWMKGINPFDVFRFFNLEDGEIPFINEEIFVQNRYYQGMKFAYGPLSILERRDSLTALYELHLSNPTNPSQSERVSKFREAFCVDQVCKDTLGKKSDFPLSDREYKYNSYSGGLLISSTAKSLLAIFDLNNDGCIAKRGEPGIDNPGDTANAKAWEDWGCSRNGHGKFDYDLSITLIKDPDGNVTVDLSQIEEELEEILGEYYEAINDPRCSIEEMNKEENVDFCAIPSEISSINEALDGFVGDLEEVINILDNLGMKTGENCEEVDEENYCEEVNNAMKDEIEKYKDYASFYKVGTRIDEDGDGCIDEDLLNGMDNDGDGSKSTDARLAPSDPAKPLTWGITNIMGYHSMTGDPEMDKPIRLPAPQNICNNADCTILSRLWPPDDDESDSVTVIRFTQEPGYWTSNSLEDKLRVAQDTACPPQISLEERKALIGGCWRWYDEEKFVRYWLKRELSPDASRKHPSCVACTTDQCLGKE
jgi:hypothetical protein